ncbi:lysozyme family protein [Peribacillus sp. SCS-155]|uniref:lysozyme family protein n=1 Tax=Peribacillus sedimenti TaxID=3115297 RepID=UPI003905E802
MYQESHGKGNDPMQSSESAGLRRNSIASPEKSIKQGVFNFNEMYKYGRKRRVDLNTIIQSYNMGPGYIDYVTDNGLKHSETLEKAYSKSQVEKSPSLYTCGKDIGNFRFPYCFGDFTYADKVNDKLS